MGVRMSKHRIKSEGDIYHVTSRGTGKQLIFEDDDDRRFFLRLLHETLSSHAVDLYAWCLMDNHFHLLLHGALETVSLCMRHLCSSYARRFNERAGRTGHLFQGRFGSEAIDTDAYLLIVVRYIHKNPEKAGLAHTSAYRWSSYREYLGHPTLCKTQFVLDVFGDKQAFASFHAQNDEEAGCLDVDMSRMAKRKAIDARALRKAQRVMAGMKLTDLKTLPKKTRDAHLRDMKRSGLSIRQIERLTGIGRNVVANA